MKIAASLVLTEELVCSFKDVDEKHKYANATLRSILAKEIVGISDYKTTTVGIGEHHTIAGHYCSLLEYRNLRNRMLDIISDPNMTSNDQRSKINELFEDTEKEPLLEGYDNEVIRLREEIDRLNKRNLSRIDQSAKYRNERDEDARSIASLRDTVKILTQKRDESWRKEHEMSKELGKVQKELSEAKSYQMNTVLELGAQIQAIKSMNEKLEKEQAVYVTAHREKDDCISRLKDHNQAQREEISKMHEKEQDAYSEFNRKLSVKENTITVLRGELVKEEDLVELLRLEGTHLHQLIAMEKSFVPKCDPKPSKPSLKDGSELGHLAYRVGINEVDIQEIRNKSRAPWWRFGGKR